MPNDPAPFLTIVGKSLEDAVPPEEAGFDREPPRGKPKGGLPDGCPVVPLGVEGSTYYYLDELRQFRSVSAKDHTRNTFISLFQRRSDLITKFWPRHGKNGEPLGVPDFNSAGEALMRAAAQRQLMTGLANLRGVGAWCDDDGRLVWHTGRAVVRCEPNGALQQFQPGLVDGYIYPAEPPIPGPEQVDPYDVRRHLDELYGLLQTWRFKRGELDARLLLGWIGAALIGGALEWRPLVWLTGSKSTGKSTLQRLLSGLYGGAMVQVSDASAAGLWQELGRSTVPVAVDELESEAEPRRTEAVIKLARQAASGGLVLRGGADHKATRFLARSGFLFSSILIPPLSGQDRSRLAILELEELAKGCPVPDLGRKRLARFGAALRARLASQWARFEPTLEVMRAALQQRGHSARGADQFGVLLAVADLLLSDHAPEEADSLHELVEPLAAAHLAETADDESDERMCLDHLMGSVIDPYRGGARSTVGRWLDKARHLGEPGERDQQAIDANRVLVTYGLRMKFGHDEQGRPARWLLVANAHPGLAELYRNTHWGSRSGATGVWTQALRRLPGAVPVHQVRFDGRRVRATALPLSTVWPEGEDGERTVG